MSVTAPTTITASPYVAPNPSAPGGVTASPYSAPNPSAPGGVTASPYVPPSPVAPLSMLDATAASLTVDPTGDDNAFVLTARTPGTGGNAITFTIAAAVNTASTLITTGNDIVFTPATRHRLIFTNSARTAELASSGSATYNGKPYWGGSLVGPFSPGTSRIYHDGTKWIAFSQDEYRAEKVSTADNPDTLTDWTIVEGSGQPTITPEASRASDVLARINATWPAIPNILVSGALAEGSDGTGPITTTLAQTNLSGGSNGVPIPVAPLPIT